MAVSLQDMIKRGEIVISDEAYAALLRGIRASHTNGGVIEIPSLVTTDPAAEPNPQIYTRLSGGKQQLCVRFVSGNIQVLATEP